VVHNAGQDCASVERVVVHSRVADTFLPRLVAAMNAAASQVPGLVTPRQREIVIAQLEDARDRGAKFLCGGLPVDDGPIQPTLITGLSRDALAWREESFGPIAVVEVHDTDEALLAAANDTSFGLGGSVWGQDLRRAEALGRRLRTGMVWVNNHAFTGALPDLPWVGRGASGLGITSSPETMEHLTRPRLVVIDKSAALEPWWYPYGETLVDLMRVLIERKRVGGIGVTIRTLQTLGRRNKVVASAGK
jgi:acyl-CoA reductase-like NAD-dependent aldehyde dehydrogenase